MPRPAKAPAAGYRRAPLLRSTFSRALTAILVAQLLTVALAAVTLVPLAYQGRVNLIVSLLDGVIAGIRASAETLPAEQQLRLLQNAGLELSKDRPASGSATEFGFLLRVRQIESDIGAALDAEVIFERRAPGQLVIWVRRPDLLGGAWLGVERSQEPLQLGQWLSLWGSLTLLFAILTAVLFSLTVSRPLRSLASAADTSAKAGEPLLWQPSGAEEIRHLGAIVANAHARLDRHYREQQLVLAAASHDMRTPLSRLRLAVDLLPANESALVQDMTRDIEEIDDQIGEFLRLLRLGLQEPTVELDLALILRNIARQYGNDSREIHYQGPPVLVRRLSARALQWILRALVQNAIEHGRPPIALNLSTEPGALRIRIRDHGAGVAEDRLPLLGRQVASRSRGHGLVVCRRLIEDLGGRLEFSNAEPGLVAEIVLPAR
jgi:two-component system osmolarity sensor histidine kinase EnvZ